MTTVYPALSSLEYTPLTADNLKKKGQFELESNVHPNPTLLERYCQDILTASPNSFGPPLTTTTTKRRKQRSNSSIQPKSRPSSERRQSSSIKSSTSTNRDNTVMESPRLLPFPYHNDSLFLPTVEQHRRLERAKSVASIKTSSSYGNHHHSHLHYQSIINNNTNTSNLPSTLSSEFSSPLPASTPKRQSSAPPVLSTRRKLHHVDDSGQEPSQPSSLTAERSPSRQPSKNRNLPCSPSTPTKSSPSWLRKIWKIFKMSSWRHRFSSTKTMVSVVS